MSISEHSLNRLWIYFRKRMPGIWLASEKAKIKCIRDIATLARDMKRVERQDEYDFGLKARDAQILKLQEKIDELNKTIRGWEQLVRDGTLVLVPKPERQAPQPPFLQTLDPRTGKLLPAQGTRTGRILPSSPQPKSTPSARSSLSTRDSAADSGINHAAMFGMLHGQAAATPTSSSSPSCSPSSSSAPSSSYSSGGYSDSGSSSSSDSGGSSCE